MSKTKERRDYTYGAGRFHDIEHVKRANKDAGQYFFEPDTMRFFSSRISERLEAGRYFVTSEQGPSGVRAYTVREAMPDGSIEDVSGFQRFSSSAQAWRYVKTLRPLSVDKEDAAALLALVDKYGPPESLAGVLEHARKVEHEHGADVIEGGEGAEVIAGALRAVLAKIEELRERAQERPELESKLRRIAWND